MIRREFLTVGVIGSLSGVAGCLGNSEEESTAETSTATPTPTVAPASFEIVEIDVPDAADLNQDFRVEIEIENTGARDGVWSAPLEIRETSWSDDKRSGWYDLNAELPVQAGETRVWESRPFSFEEPAVVHFKMEGEDVGSTYVPDGKSPVITESNLVSGWESFGDAIANKIQQTEAGSVVDIATRYWYWAEDQTNKTFKQVEIYDEQGDRVGFETRESEQVMDYGGWSRWESSFSFDSEGWGPGEYTAEILIRDEQSGEVSNEGSLTFSLE